MKKIAFTIIDNGIEGREKDHVIEAFWDEKQRDDAFETSPNKGYYRKGEQIIDDLAAQKAATAKLNGIDKLALGFVPDAKVYRGDQRR